MHRVRLAATVIAAALAVGASNSHADSGAYRERHQHANNAGDALLDFQVRHLESAIRDKWIGELRAKAERNKRELEKTPGKGMLFEVRVFKSTWSGQPTTGASPLGFYGAGATAADALYAGMQSGQIGNPDPQGRIVWDSLNSGYVFVSLSTTGSLVYKAYFGPFATSLELEAQRIASSRNARSSAALLGPKGLGVPLVGGTAPASDISTPAPSTRQKENTANRARQQSIRESQQTDRVERYKDEQEHWGQNLDAGSDDDHEGPQPRERAPKGGGTPSGGGKKGKGGGNKSNQKEPRDPEPRGQRATLA
jgi:hypothetical protein